MEEGTVEIWGPKETHILFVVLAKKEGRGEENFESLKRKRWMEWQISR